MKHLLRYLACGLAVATLCSCEKDLEPATGSESRLNFVFKNSRGHDLLASEVDDDMRTTHHSFATEPESVREMTVTFDIATMGDISAEDRPFLIEQVPVEGEENAVAGKHYVDFSQAAAQNVVKAGANTARLSVTLLRDASLREHSVTLRIRFKDNGVFRPGFAGLTERTLVVADFLSKPAMWDEADLDYQFGTYGQQKHKLMIEWTGQPWDDAYITEATKDYAYITYYLAPFFAKRLAEENAKRLAEGLDVYRESDGTEVSFEPKSWW